MDYRAPDPDLVRLGAEWLDTEHEAQLEEMNALGQAIADGKPKSEILAAIDHLVEFLEGHFLSEQIAMREWAYPDYESHVREHDNAVGLLRDLRVRMVADDPDAAGEVIRGLRGWLLGHVRSADADLARFLGANPSASA
jgi:hemerythrin-like metal-binding protein